MARRSWANPFRWRHSMRFSWRRLAASNYSQLPPASPLGLATRRLRPSSTKSTLPIGWAVCGTTLSAGQERPDEGEQGSSSRFEKREVEELADWEFPCYPFCLPHVAYRLRGQSRVNFSVWRLGPFVVVIDLRGQIFVL